MKITIDVSDISLNLSDDFDKSIETASGVAKKTGLGFHAGVKRRTPVDTGRARSGWDIDLTGSGAIVQNEVPYVGRLNRGSSTQAPAGFIEAELDAALRRSMR